MLCHFDRTSPAEGAKLYIVKLYATNIGLKNEYNCLRYKKSCLNLQPLVRIWDIKL